MLPGHELSYLTVDQLLCGFRDKKFSPVEVTREALQRIDYYQDPFNAFCFVDHEGALNSARASEARWQKGQAAGALDGIPATIKTTQLVKGWRSSFGSRADQQTTPSTVDSPATARLREAGAVLLGLTTSPEFAARASTDSALHGVTRNPWHSGKTPGGSSGGSSVAAALGMGALHLGTDGGGSIRIPASFTGVFGFKPGMGRVPLLSGPSHALSYTGPITRTVRDACWMLDSIGKPDARDWDYLDTDPVDYRGIGIPSMQGVRIAYVPQIAGHAVDAEVAAIVAAAVGAFRDMGAIVETVDHLPYKSLGSAFPAIWHSLLGERVALVPEEKRAMVEPYLLHLYREAEKLSWLDIVSAHRHRAELGCAMREFHQDYDLLLTPTVSIPPFDADTHEDPESPHWRFTEWAYFTYFFNLTRQPAASVPCGQTKDGLPVGLQIVGAHHRDRAVLEAAYAFEHARPWPFITEPRSPSKQSVTAQGVFAS